MSEPMDIATFERKAGEVSNLLKGIANGRRLMVLCKLAERGEMKVGDLAAEVGLSQSALSQHLAKMRQEMLVDFRRDGQTLWYRLADPRIQALLDTLYRLYCND